MRTRTRYNTMRTGALLAALTTLFVVLLPVPSVHAKAASSLRVHVKSRTAQQQQLQQHEQLLKAAGDTSSTQTTSALEASCAAFAKSSQGQSAVLSINCPSACRDSNFCIYYPAAARGNCTNSCFDSDTCTFECLSTLGGAGSWYITVYDNDDTFAEIAAENARQVTPSVLVNASVVTKLDDAFVRPSVFDQLTVVGNELGSSLLEGNGATDEFLPQGDVVSFTFPSDFLSQLSGLEFIRIENVPFPPSSSSDQLVFTKLDTLYASNTLLESMPIRAKSLPVLTGLDLSYNNIRALKEGMLPLSLTFLDVSYNLLDEIPADVKKMENLTILYLWSNPLRNISKGSIPESLEVLSCRNCSLQQIPEDVAGLEALIELDLSENNLTSPASLDLSKLPSELQSLILDSIGLQEIPANLKRLSSLYSLSLNSNLLKQIDVSRIPAQLSTLYVDNCGLSALPPGLKELSNLTELNALGNPFTELQPGSLPQSLKTLSIRNAHLPMVPAGVLPSSMTTLAIQMSGMTDTPSDLAQMKQLEIIALGGNNLTTFQLTDNLQTLTQINLSRNSLTTFSAQLPITVLIALRDNKLTSFEATKASNVASLDLGNNALSAVPQSIFNMTKLFILDLSGNPIRNYIPSVEEFAFLGKLSTLTMDASQFSAVCSDNQTQMLHDYTICTPGSTVGIGTSSDGGKKSSTLSVMLNVCLVLVLVLVLAAAWHKRKLRQQKIKELIEKEIAQYKTRDSGIWEDEVLLKHRLDIDLVKRVTLVSSGMFGEVWLGMYKKKKVAIKLLKEKDANRQLINDFVDEIKLLSTFTHPKVVRFIGVVWTKESDIAVLTEFMARGDLRSYLDKQHLKKKLSGGGGNGADSEGGWDASKIRIALDVTEALVYLHSLEPTLIHRDLKSRNVLLDSDMNAKLSDFGVSRYKIDEETMTAGVGTIRWIAPEVLAGEHYDESVDIFSLGVILSEIDTLKIPYFDAKGEENELLSDTAIANLVLAGLLTVSFTPSCPPKIVALATRCTSHDPSKRPNALQVAFELRTLLLQSHSGSTLSLASNDRQIEEDEHEEVEEVETEEEVAVAAHGVIAV